MNPPKLLTEEEVAEIRRLLNLVQSAMGCGGNGSRGDRWLLLQGTSALLAEREGLRVELYLETCRANVTKDASDDYKSRAEATEAEVERLRSRVKAAEDLLRKIQYHNICYYDTSFKSEIEEFLRDVPTPQPKAPDAPQEKDPLSGKEAPKNRVRKTGGDYEFEGVVVAEFPKRSGAVRVVVEDDRGLLFIFHPEQLMPVPAEGDAS